MKAFRILGVSWSAMALGSILLGACSETTTETGTSSSVTGSPTSTFTTLSTPTPYSAGTKIVFVNPVSQSAYVGRSYGTLFMANADGSSPVELAPGEEASFVGFGRQRSAVVVYYMAKVSETESLLRQRDLASGEVKDITSVTAPEKSDAPPSGDISPNGTQIALHHAEGIDIVDASTGQGRRLVTSDGSGCDAVPVDFDRCYGFYGPEWSPDGRYLTARRMFFEGGEDVLIDPSVDESQFTSLGVENAGWAPSSDRVCGSEGGYDPRILYAAPVPTDGSQVVLEFEANPARQQRILDCTWLGGGRIAVVTSLDGVDTVLVVSADGGGTEELLRLESPLSIGRVFGIDDTHVVLNIFDQDAQDYASPLILDVSTGATTTILDPGTRVVAVSILRGG